MQRHLELESYDPKTKEAIKQNLRYHTKNIESGRTSEVVAFPQSKWQIVRELAQKASR
jgi:Mg/Co/Ni transporter MgtE